MKRTIASILLFFLFFSETNAFQEYFIFGLRLQDNDYDIAKRIEQRFDLNVPLISVIYDDFNKGEQEKLARTFEELGNQRVYHVDVNPFGYDLPTLINDPQHKGWEKKYRTLFKLIKRYNVKVIFRFLHEMNGGWYSWASDPDNFPVFWRMVWKWSREEGLDRSNILFDFSLNSQDLPVQEGYSVDQLSPVITCNQIKKIQIGCLTFEDYYPGDEYVDMLGVTIYNWGKGARKEDWATWRTPIDVINEPGYWTFDRMKRFGKPIFIDEAGSTSINIENTPFDNDKLIKIYNDNHFGFPGFPAEGTAAKNYWISQLQDLYSDPQVIGGAYFNADVTYGFTDRSKIGELDWTAIDPDKYFAYPSIIKLLNDKRELRSPILYFDPPKDFISSRLWLTDDDMQELQQYLSKYIVFQEGQILSSPTFYGTYRYPKYSLFLEKYIGNDPGLCSALNKKNPKVKCSVIEDKSTADKKLAFNLIKNEVDNSAEVLSNWGVWQKIEGLKMVFNSQLNSKNPKLSKDSIRNILAYFDFYEKTYLDLR